MPPLTETEKKIIALSLFGYVMRAGPGQFARTIDIANKIGVTQELEAYANAWVNTSKSTPTASLTIITDAHATVKFAIFHGITTQWHQKEDPNFAEILKDSVYKELFEGIHYKWAIRELIEPTVNNKQTP